MFAVFAVMAPVVAPNPAGAATAPLLTEEGLGIRIDEWALDGPVLEALEDAIQPTVNDMIHDGATAPGQPFGGNIGVTVSSNVELSLDFLVPGGSRPKGGLRVHADLEDITIRYKMDPIWPFADCYIWVRPDTGTVDVTAKVDDTKLPNAPVTIEPTVATWDNSPDVTSDGICWTYVVWQGITQWWNGIWNSSDPNSTAAQIEDAVDGIAQDLIDGLWADHVRPVVDSLEGFGITFNEIYTDTYGLIVTADVNATGGLTLPGLGGPYDVSNTEDSGADSDIHALLAQWNDIIVSIHPNVVNQFLNALNQVTLGTMGTIAVDGPTVEAFLLPEGLWGNYTDHQWTMNLSVQAPYYTVPSGSGGAPQLVLPQARFQFRHPQEFFGTRPVATFAGSMSGIDLVTEERDADDMWGPAFVAGGDSDVDLTLLSGVTNTNANVFTFGPDPDGVLPYAQDAIDEFTTDTLVPFLSLAPIEIAGFSIDLCTWCGRYPNDERYTETFLVN